MLTRHCRGRAIAIGTLLLACALALPHSMADKGADSQPGPMVLSLRVKSVASIDLCELNPGNVNGVWEPGETIELFVELRTDSSAGFSGIQGTLQSQNPDVVFLQGTAEWPPVTPGASAFNAEPFRIELANRIACFEDVGLVLALDTDQGIEGPFILPNVIGAGFEVDLPVPIEDITAGDEIPMEVFDDNIIQDLDVHIVVETTWVGDLGITLRSPAGTEVLLLDRPGHPASAFGCSNDDMDITFDDSSTFDPEDHCEGTAPWYVGSASPVGSLSDFNGELTQGTWTLIVSDSGGGDLAEIQNWELLATPTIEGPCVVCGESKPVPAQDRRGVIALALLLVLIGAVAVLRRASL